MTDLKRFSLSDMVAFSAALRRMAEGCDSMEEVADRLVRFLFENLVDRDAGLRECALVRFFKTHPFGALDPELQAYVRDGMNGEIGRPDMKCLTLLASAGEAPGWNSRRHSSRFKCIPLNGEGFVTQFPMVGQILKQFGVEPRWLIAPSPSLLVDLEQHSYNVFYVPDAEGSPYVPAQEEFVLPYGIKSVLGIGGLLPSGHLYVLVLFSKAGISRDTADLFRTLAVSVKAAVLPFDGGPVFAGERVSVPPGRAEARRAEQLRSHLATLEQLLDVGERTSRDQSRRLEQALAQAEARALEVQAIRHLYQSLLNSAGEGIFGMDCDGRMTFVNPAAAGMLGYGIDELIGRPAHAALHHSRGDGSLYDVADCPIHQTHRDGVVRKVGEEVFRRKNGTAFPVEYTSTPIWDQGVVVGSVVVFTDVSERKQAEQFLRRHVTAMEAAMDGMAILDDRQCVTYANDAYVRIHGYDRAEELLGRNWEQLYEDQELHRLRRDALSHLVQQGRWRGEAVGRRRDGTQFPQEVSLSSLPNGGFICVVRDITGRRLLEEELRQAQKMEAVGQLAGGVAHDFNNLLTAILGYSELLLMQMDRGPMRDAVAQISKAGTRAATLTQQLLAFGRRQVLKPRIVGLNAVVADTAVMLQRLIGEHIALVTRPAPHLGLIKADPVQLQHVILNLAINARDAMPDGGRLVVETANVGSDDPEVQRRPMGRACAFVRLRVIDTGHGMDDETLSHIFEPFFTTKELGKGTGLGLSMVYGTVKQSDGFIDVRSRRGEGTSISIYFPCLEGVQEGRQEEPAAVPPLRGTETVLVVEDEELVRSLARRVLQTNGYDVLEARDGAEGLEVFRRHDRKIHLLLTDAVMPVMGGRELAEWVRAESPQVRVLFMSGYAAGTNLPPQTNGSAKFLIQKPFTPDALLERVRAVLDQP